MVEAGEGAGTAAAGMAGPASATTAAGTEAAPFLRAISVTGVASRKCRESNADVTAAGIPADGGCAAPAGGCAGGEVERAGAAGSGTNGEGPFGGGSPGPSAGGGVVDIVGCGDGGAGQGGADGARTDGGG